MRPGSTMLSARRPLTFEQRQQSIRQSSLCHIKNKVACVFFIIFLTLIFIYCAIYSDVAAHSDIPQETQPQKRGQITIEEEPIINTHPTSDSHSETHHVHHHKNGNINIDDIAITSLARTSYISTLDINHDNFLNLLHRRSLGFALEDYELMSSILSEYGRFAHNTMEQDIANNKLNGKYIIITPAAQMCNRMRALMGTMLLGILTQRVVFIDIGAEGYAARLNRIFISPGYEWEYQSIPSSLKSLLKSAKNTKWTFPYEYLETNRAVSGVILSQVCNSYCSGTPCKPGDNGNVVWKIDSHAAYLPVMARNENLYKAVLTWYEEMRNTDETVEYMFDYKLATFMGKIATDGQEYIETLEVLLGRMMFRLEEEIQKAVDALIHETYDKAMIYYRDKGVDVSLYDMIDNPPPVIGIHIRSEYVLLMNPKECRGHDIRNCERPYNWFEECGIVAMDRNIDLNGIKPYLYIAADTKDAQSAAQQIFGEDRVYFRPFDKTGGSFEGIQEAIIDLVSVSSFDAFVGTPHSSYSEMASILSQPRRVYHEKENKFIFKWSLDDVNKHLIPVNRMIIPIMTSVGWEIDKLNLYTMGRTVDVQILIDDDDKNAKQYNILLPQTDQNKQKYIQNKICKQTITAGMGWMGLFNMLKNVQCYNPKWHHPSPKWFPIANK